MKSSVTRAIVPALAAALLGVGVQAQTPRFARWGQSLTPAAEATRSLGHLIRPLAARHRRSEAAMRALLQRDRDLWLDPQARLVYQCEPKQPVPAAALPAAKAEALSAPPYPAEQTFQLHSRPTAPRKIYLDFDGHTTSGTWWNEDTNGAPIVSTAFDTDGNSASFSSAEVEAIQQMWQRVAEDYAPFEVDVTTQDPGVDGLRRTSSGDEYFGVRVVISPTDGWFGNSGGVAYLSVFSMVNTGNDLPAFVFSANLSNNERNIAEAASHEAGHTLGLEHDGKSGTEYFTGNSGSDWAPIMGAGYYKNVTHWSKGEYSGASQTQDDYVLMQQNGALFRADDHGSSLATATVLSGSTPAASGTIEQRTDKDFFRFSTGAGSITLSASAGPRGANLDLRLDLYDANGALVTSADPAGLPATLTRTVAAGTYYVSVDGVGAGDVATTGYSDYGSLGQYTLGASLVPTTLQGSLTVISPNGGEIWQVGSSQNLTWSSSGVSGSVKLEYTTNGSTWTVINANTANDGGEPWTVPAAPTSQARVRVTSLGDASVTDTSNGAFSIVSVPVASITVTSPNGGESWTVGTVRTITWSSSNVSGSVRIDYSTDAGSTWTPITGSILNDGSENWMVPNTPSGSVLVRVAATDGSASDASNSVFTIAGNPGDSYEPDDSAGTAKTISSGQTQSRSIHQAGNADWVKIVLPSRLVTTVTTSGVAGGDTILYLYSSNGTSLLASNDNYSKKHRYSRLSKRLSAGTYYVRVVGKNNSTLSSYTLSLATRR